MNRKEKIAFWIVWTLFVYFLAVCTLDIVRGNIPYDLRGQFDALKKTFQEYKKESAGKLVDTKSFIHLNERVIKLENQCSNIINTLSELKQFQEKSLSKEPFVKSKRFLFF